MTSVIQFENPPPSNQRGRSRKDINEWLEELKTHEPLQWAKYPFPPDAHTASALREGRYKAAKPGEFNATQKTIDGTLHVWVMYLGDPDAKK